MKNLIWEYWPTYLTGMSAFIAFVATFGSAYQGNKANQELKDQNKQLTDQVESFRNRNEQLQKENRIRTDSLKELAIKTTGLQVLNIDLLKQNYNLLETTRKAQEKEIERNSETGSMK